MQPIKKPIRQDMTTFIEKFGEFVLEKELETKYFSKRSMLLFGHS